MNKEIIVHLLQRDIKELSLLTEGFEKMTEFPEPILRLAKEKTENVLSALESLFDLNTLELGAIDYSTFGDDSNTPNSDSNETFLTEKNNFDTPADSALEIQIDSYEIENLETNSKRPDDQPTPSDNFIERESESSDKATELIDKHTINDEEVKSDFKSEEIQRQNNHRLIETKVITSETSYTEKAEKHSSILSNSTLNDTLLHEDTSIGTNLVNQKIDDIKQAINIGDRFRFQRELFGGNGEVLNKTIAYLNQLANFSEAESFLKSKFGWDENNMDADDFLQIVKRRYF